MATGDLLKLVVVGGGSSYTPELVEGLILRRDRLPLSELALVDLPQARDKVEAVAGLSRRMLERAGLGGVRVTVHFDRRPALDGADFMLSQFRVGGLRARVLDERIPLRHGVVGQETTGPGGFAKALRTVPVALDLARDVEELCPDAWVMNFTNPAGVVTEAVTRYRPGVKIIGLCNVPVSIQRTISDHLGVEPWRVELDLVGLNHLGWVTAVRLDGRDILPAILALPVVEAEFVRNIPAAKGMGGLLRDLGMLPSPYLQYYYYRAELLEEELRAVESGRGTRGEQVMEVERTLLERYRDPDLVEKPPELSQRGGAFYSEAALDVMVALVGRAGAAVSEAGTPSTVAFDRHIVNVPNRRVPEGGPVLPDLGEEAVIETPCLVTPEGPRPLGGGPLPLAVRGLVQQVKAYEQLTIEAAVTGDRKLAFLALLNHPLVPGAARARALLEEILEVHREHLPLFWPEG
ncbi:MAG: 6-phospho-beta-glucosidase [Firmicutes bacterium]|nr:6-phospho-beta-glucosidase [Bacillota bacterium]